MSLRRDAWIEEEPRLLATAARVLARARHRPLRVAAATLVATLVATGYWLTRPPLHLATSTFRIQERGLQDPRAAPRAPSAILEHLYVTAFGRSQLLPLMERYGISTAFRARDENAALDEFRAGIGVDVRRNEFLIAAESGERRSAHVILSFSHPSREVARALLHDLGDLVLARQLSARGDLIERALGESERLLRASRAELDSIGHPGSRGTPEFARQRVLDRLTALEARRAKLALALAAEREALGLSFERVDESIRTLRGPATPARGVALAACLGLVSLILSAVLVGAFDDHILRGPDVLARGLPLLGTLKAP